MYVGVSELDTLPIIPKSCIYSVLFFNAQSVCGKLSHLHDFIHNRLVIPSVIGVVETLFNDSVPDMCLNLNMNYLILRFNRPSHGGGVMLLVANGLHIVDSRKFSFGKIQVLYADIQFSTLLLVRFICVYHPPNTDMINSLAFITALESYIIPSDKDRFTVIMGDFNLTKILIKPLRTLNFYFFLNAVALSSWSLNLLMICTLLI